MNAHRRREILDRVQRSGFVSYKELAAEFGVSAPTARHEIEALADAGFVKRFRGGASSLAPSESLLEPIDRGAEAAITWSASILAKPGMTIGIVGGYAAAAIAHDLCSVPGITIVTNSLAVLEAIARRSITAASPSVVMLPGSIDSDGSVTGSMSVQALRELYLDVTYLSVQGFDSRDRVFSERVDAALVGRAFLSSSRKSIALAASSRWANRLQAAVASLPDLHLIVSDPGLSASDRELINSSGVSLTIAGYRPGASSFTQRNSALALSG